MCSRPPSTPVVGDPQLQHLDPQPAAAQHVGSHVVRRAEAALPPPACPPRGSPYPRFPNVRSRSRPAPPALPPPRGARTAARSGPAEQHAPPPYRGREAERRAPREAAAVRPGRRAARDGPRPTRPPIPQSGAGSPAPPAARQRLTHRHRPAVLWCLAPSRRPPAPLPAPPLRARPNEAGATFPRTRPECASAIIPPPSAAIPRSRPGARPSPPSTAVTCGLRTPLRQKRARTSLGLAGCRPCPLLPSPFWLRHTRLAHGPAHSPLDRPARPYNSAHGSLESTSQPMSAKTLFRMANRS
ncbi:basic proline-rich protein isoform X2 [Gallus gallus]|uniref:basic proline-rich protein isoform X2 n=1 Tax=Gallus gallus TaxID=9031 RepID=UPI001F014325|nr:basic proline-rich protein isoform X2 [Gallus gallus]